MERIKEYDLMAVWIDKFKAEIGRGGVAESNKFEIQIDPPAKLQTREAGHGRLSVNDHDGLVIRAESINVAGRAIATMDDSNIYGPIRQLPTGVTYAEDITINFIMSRNLWERGYFDTWQQIVFDTQTWNLGYYNDFIGSLGVFALDRYQKRTWGLTYHEVYPKTIGAVAFDMTGLNIVKIPINFAFRYWTEISDATLASRGSALADDSADLYLTTRRGEIRNTVNKMENTIAIHTAKGA